MKEEKECGYTPLCTVRNLPLKVMLNFLTPKEIFLGDEFGISEKALEKKPLVDLIVKICNKYKGVKYGKSLRNEEVTPNYPFNYFDFEISIPKAINSIELNRTKMEEELEGIIPEKRMELVLNKIVEENDTYIYITTFPIIKVEMEEISYIILNDSTLNKVVIACLKSLL